VKELRLFALLTTALTLVLAPVACGSQPEKDLATTAVAREIPFEMRGGVVLVPVTVGQSRVLRILLDTGMGFDGMLLWEPVPESAFPGPTYDVRIPGAGAGEPAHGRMTDSGSFRAGPVEFEGQRVVWLVDSLMSGFPSDGVMGYSLFGHWVVELDYDRKAMKLHGPGFRPDSSWTMMAMSLGKNSTPWVKLRASVNGEAPQELDCYIDLAANDEVVFLVRDDAKFRMPDSVEPCHIGRGLSGDIYGSKGRAELVQLDTCRFRDLVVSFAPDSVRSKQPGADAVIGASLLARFNTVYDYAGGRMYIKRRTL